MAQKPALNYSRMAEAKWTIKWLAGEYGLKASDIKLPEMQQHVKGLTATEFKNAMIDAKSEGFVNPKRKKNPRHLGSAKALIGPYTFEAVDGAYDWHYADPDAAFVAVGFGGDALTGSRKDREMFWDAVQMFIRKYPGEAIVAWGYRRGEGYGLSVMKRSIAKQNSIPFVSMSGALAARRVAPRGKIPRSVAVLQA